MKANFKRALAAAACTAVAAGAISTTAFASEETVSGDTSAYPDSAAIVEAMGAGWNLGNQLEANINEVPSETIWGNPKITQETLNMVKDAGFDTVRIPVSYLSKIGDAESGYKIDEAWLNRVQEVVDYAMEADLYVIINIHGDGYYSVKGGWLLCVDENQTEIKEKYEAVWTQIAEKFKDYDEHLIFESMNEVFDGQHGQPDRDGYANINDYNQIFVDTVRATGSVNSERWLLVPGWNTNIDYTVNTIGYGASKFGFELPDDSACTADSNRLMVSVHYYDPWGFGGEGNPEKDYFTDIWGTEEEKAYMDGQLKKMYDAFTSQGVPVIIGECGAVDKRNDEARLDWYTSIAENAAKYGCIPVVWDNNGHLSDSETTFGDKFGLFDRSTYAQTEPEIIKAVVDTVANTEFIGFAESGDSSSSDDSSSEADSSSETTTSSEADTSSETTTSDESVTSSDSTASATSSTSSAASSAASSSKASTGTTSSNKSSTDTSPATGANGGALAAIAIVCAGAALTVIKKRK